MTYLNNAADILKSNGFIKSYSEFSRVFCGKNVNWTAYQNHKGRDFSISAAINCLSNIQLRARAMAKLASSDLPCSPMEFEALKIAEHAVKSFLWEKHQISTNNKQFVFIKK